MEGSGDGSPQSSMCMVKAAELFPKPVLEKEEEKLTVHFAELAGESVKYLGKNEDGVLALSNYRLFLLKNSTGAETSVPLGLIESTQVRDLSQLIINCKDASTVKCTFKTSEQCSEWQRRITLSIGVPETLECLFAFPFHAWASESPTLNQDNEWYGRLQRVGNYDDDFRKEVERLQFDLRGAWRISHVNAEFKLCPSYPRMLLVPACISDDTLQNVASFRSSRRIPAVVWRHERTGAVIARCSQPEVGWLGWRNSKDEQLLKALSDACAFDRGTENASRTRHNSTASNESSPPSPEGSHEEVEMDEPKKILIVDARSYASAVTNRARGGGCECAEYYPSAEIQFMNLGNIHVIRKSFHALRQLCSTQSDIPNWLSLLERTMWLQHVAGLLTASMTVCRAIEAKGRPVLVHCSDGWDRTPQIVATAQLCLDPYYRTIEGFRVLVEREWLSFGHKFADRCGHGPGSDETNERCPVFLQWLDCVHQIHQQFPCSFEFDMGYLIKLAQHSHSCLFGSFLCNTVKERQENSVPDRTFSVWPFISGPMYKNHLYVPNRERVLWPAYSVRDLRLWTEVYLGSWGGNQSCADYPANGDGVSGQELSGSMTKTRSYGDLMTGINEGGLTRRSSDPNMTVDSSILAGSLNLSAENSIDSNVSSDREISPDLIDHHTSSLAMIQHTTQKLQSLTQELNQSDEELENNIKNTKRGAIGEQLQQRSPVASEIITSSLFINGNSDSYNFKPIVPEQPTAPAVVPQSSTPPPALQRHHLMDEIDENTSRIVKIESYLGDVVDGRPNAVRVAKPIPATDAIGGFGSTDMMESVDLSGKSPSPPTVPPSPQHSGANLWHGSVETSTDTLVPLDQYPSPKRIAINRLDAGTLESDDCCEDTETTIDLDTTLKAESTTLEDDIADGIIKQDDSISLDVANSNGRHDHHKDLNVSNGSDFTTSTTAAAQTGDSNGCDLFSDSKNRKNFNHGKTRNENNQNSIPKEHVDSRVRNILPDGRPPTQPLVATQCPEGKKQKYSNLMDESIIMQPQFQQLEINGKHPTDTGSAVYSHQQFSSFPYHQHHSQINHSAVAGGVQIQPQQQQPQQQQQQQQLQQHVALSHYQPQNQRRRRNSSNSKNDMSPNKPTNGSISPSATNSRFSTPGARSLPLTPPSVPFSAERPPVAALSCPDGLAHALSEQNLRLQQIVYEHRLREEALQRELYATRLALLKRTCHNCNNQQYGNDDPTSMVDSIIENASNCSWEAVDERSAPSSGANSSQQITSSVLWVPDHAVSRCTTCQIEFWLGRRKHHCRSCGQIFCADCSEYWAPLPDEKLFQPVRLCGPCYQNVSGKIVGGNQQPTMSGSSATVSNSVVSGQHGNFMNGSVLVATKQHNGSSASTPAAVSHEANNNSVAAALMTSINTVATNSLSSNLENCKHAAASATITSTSCSASANSNSDRGTCKATTATN
ncbi:myotubularin-related protein 3 isoform X2 [Sabethes cyaneus]|nr:myotubularin-related protein 3 isoform X2 [Sabethes cyaneus]XP_053697625.1 myotubularin-related protein 3 isoform X2 [Sabethes cyaneus]XP_053697626.1 myotubularin-related protein 3 isoform X2 [Sabethes cyaneus]XP_053697627.1 myotubularin-related protein 3 isoform X2 [Sabethes cyaneus]XP_053697628.1 myotubularin-related protein 3 isoform X2 [Sabethes cyaneus]XP_053697629.1 myotubularin-related protein 3 isoform X2 [Sabethes cyaneus]